MPVQLFHGISMDGWCEPILVDGLTYIGSFHDLYRSLRGPI